jgi:hypothetical protein
MSAAPFGFHTHACQQSPASAADAGHSGSSSCQPPQSGPEQLQLSSSVVGYIVVQVNSVTAHINKLAVAAEARRAGLATLLLRVRAHAWHLQLESNKHRQCSSFFINPVCQVLVSLENTCQACAKPSG